MPNFQKPNQNWSSLLIASLFFICPSFFYLQSKSRFPLPSILDWSPSLISFLLKPLLKMEHLPIQEHRRTSSQIHCFPPSRKTQQPKGFGYFKSRFNLWPSLIPLRSWTNPEVPQGSSSRNPSGVSDLWKFPWGSRRHFEASLSDISSCFTRDSSRSSGDGGL